MWINTTTRESKPDPPTPEQFQALRKQPTNYITFADMMIRAVHGKSPYGDRTNTTSFNTLISKSQEAFTLLLHENGYKNWVWAARNDPGSTSDTDGGGGNTTGSCCPAHGHTPGRNGGWSTEGMLKCNDLHHKVAAERAMDNGEFERAHTAHRVNKFKAPKKKRKRGEANDTVPILDDLEDLRAPNEDDGETEAVWFWFGLKDWTKDTKSTIRIKINYIGIENGQVEWSLNIGFQLQRTLETSFVI
jgi:hypothetical protein